MRKLKYDEQTQVAGGFLHTACILSGAMVCDVLVSNYLPKPQAGGFNFLNRAPSIESSAKFIVSLGSVILGGVIGSGIYYMREILAQMSADSARRSNLDNRG